MTSNKETLSNQPIDARIGYKADWAWNMMICKASLGDQAAINVLDMIDEHAVDPFDNYRLIELYDAGRGN